MSSGEMACIEPLRWLIFWLKKCHFELFNEENTLDTVTSLYLGKAGAILFRNQLSI